MKKVKYMSKYVLALSLLLILHTPVTAQKYGTIKGAIFDSTRKYPLPGAVVTLQNTKLGWNTNIDGQYIINSIPAGKYNINARMMGYKNKTLKDVNIQGDSTYVIDFYLYSPFVPPEFYQDVKSKNLITKLLNNYKTCNTYHDSFSVTSVIYGGGILVRPFKPTQCRLIDTTIYTLYEKPNKLFYKVNSDSSYAVGTPLGQSIQGWESLKGVYTIITDIIMQKPGIIDWSHLSMDTTFKANQKPYYRFVSVDTGRIYYALLVDYKKLLIKELVIRDRSACDAALNTTIKYYPEINRKTRGAK